jgi:hypothetical protein
MIESFPEGASVSHPVKSSNSSNPTFMCGTVISIPIQQKSHQLPNSDGNFALPYA